MALRVRLVLALLALRFYAAEPTWTLSPQPILALGGASGAGPTEFDNVYAGALWAGRAAILDGESQTIRLFEIPSGRHIRTIGRRGQGPGEYLNAAYLQPLPGDSLFAADIQQSRFTILEPNGDLNRVVSIAALARETRLTPLGRFRDGTVLALAPRFRDVTGPGLQRVQATVYRIAADGSKADSVATLPYVTVQAMNVGAAKGWRAALAGGQMQPAVWADGGYLNSPTQFLVHAYHPTTGKWTAIQEPFQALLGTEARAAAARKAAVDQGASPELMAKVAIVDTLPAIRYPLVTGTGRLWLVDGRADSVTHTRGLTSYTREGRRDGRLLIPSSMFPLAVSDSLIMLTAQDSADVVSVLVYALRRQ